MGPTRPVGGHEVPRNRDTRRVGPDTRRTLDFQQPPLTELEETQGSGPCFKRCTVTNFL